MLSSCRIKEFLIPSSVKLSLTSTLFFIENDLHKKKPSKMRGKMPKSIHRTPKLYSIRFAFSQEFYMYVQHASTTTKWTVTNNLMQETNSNLIDQEVLQKNHECIDIFKQLFSENLKPIKGDK